MKLQPDPVAANNVVGGYTQDSVRIGQHTWRTSLLLPWQGQARAWRPRRIEDLGEEDFNAVAALEPELVLFGSGSTLRFPPARMFAVLMQRRVGVETMDTAAACRTFNLLVAEGRSVVAALLL